VLASLANIVARLFMSFLPGNENRKMHAVEAMGVTASLSLENFLAMQKDGLVFRAVADGCRRDDIFYARSQFCKAFRFSSWLLAKPLAEIH
jgi:hypothetical protein